MGDWIEAALVEEIDEGRPLPREIDGVAVALMRRGAEVRVVLDRCPHMEFPLSEGHVVDGQIECALHHWRFDVFEEPAPSVPPEVRCTVVESTVRDGRVYVRV